MSATEAVLGYQTILSRSDDASPPQMIPIAEVRNIGAFGSKRGLVEVTHLDSPDSTKEYISTLKDGMEFTAVCNLIFDTAGTQEGLLDDQDSAIARDFEIELPNSLGTFSFTALVLGWEISPDPNNPLEMTFNFKITGPIELT